MRDPSLYSDPKLKAYRHRCFKQVVKQTTMMEDIYDATLIHEPEDPDVRIDGETACPDCGERVFPDPTDDVFDAALESRIAASFDCPGCSASLEFIIEPTPTEELGLGIWVVPA